MATDLQPRDLHRAIQLGATLVSRTRASGWGPWVNAVLGRYAWAVGYGPPSEPRTPDALSQMTAYFREAGLGGYLNRGMRRAILDGRVVWATEGDPEPLPPDECACCGDACPIMPREPEPAFDPEGDLPRMWPEPPDALDLYGETVPEPPDLGGES